MENAVDALKMGAAALFFVLAFSITMLLFNQAKTTTEAVLDNLKLKNFFAKADPLKENETRRVGVESIIPTLYRYFQSDENPTIRIFDDTGDELQIFDTAIERIAHNNFDPGTTDSKTVGYYNYLRTLYSSGKADLFGAPWESQDNSLYYTERVNSYIYGTNAKHLPALNGKYDTNNLMKYKNRTFIEKYTEYKANGDVRVDQFGEEVIMRPATTKVIITYTMESL